MLGLPVGAGLSGSVSVGGLVFDFPNQESQKQSASLKTDSRTITKGLLIISAVRLMYFASFVFAVFVCLTEPLFPPLKPDAVDALLAQLLRGVVSRMSTYRKRGVLIHASGDSCFIVH